MGAACVYAGLAGSVGGDMQGPCRASERWSPSGTLAPVSSLGDKGGEVTYTGAGSNITTSRSA